MKKKQGILPDFVGIGAARSGTGWLWENLRKHPDIWMPPIKELHYFDRLPHYPSPSHLGSKYLITRVFSRKDHNRIFRLMMKKKLHRCIIKKDYKQLRWCLRYFFGTYNDRWYVSLFKEGWGKVKGEITPAYSILEPGNIEKVKRLNPRLKAIYILRNPIDRAWSNYLYTMGKQGPLVSQPLHQLKEFCNRRGMTLRGDYVQTINQWRHYFPETQFLIGFFEELRDQPLEFLKKVFQFLEVEDQPSVMTDMAFKKINTSPNKKIPPGLKIYLSRQYFAPTKKLSQMVGSYTLQWLDEMKVLLEE